MKKLFLFVFLCLGEMIGCAQSIQNTILGTELNADCLKTVKAKIKERGYFLISEDYRTLEFLNVVFAGQTWKFTNFEFVDDRLYSVCFSHPFKNKETALTQAATIANMLVRKYNKNEELIIRRIENNDEGFPTCMFGDFENCVSLDAFQANAQNGELFYYVQLYYFNAELNQKRINTIENEI